MTDAPVRPKVLRYAAAAAYLGISHGRLRNLVSMGIGPDSVTYGKRDRSFPIAALDAFIEQRMVRSRPARVEPVKVKRRPGRPRKAGSEKHKYLTHWVAIAIALYIAYLFWIYGIFDVATGSTLPS